MAFLIHPNVAYLLVITGILLLLWTINEPKFNWLKVIMVFCFLAGGYEFVYLKGNAWAFLVVALSPLPFFLAVRQTRIHNPLFFITIVMVALGGVFLFVDQNDHPMVNYGLAGLVSAIFGKVIWSISERLRNAEGGRLRDDPGSVVGLIGETCTDIEAHSAGSVRVEGEVWQALSKKPIPAGRTVRVLRQDGFVLTVKETKNLTEKRKL
jgi:membrane-bound serine protease (ClpP class)